MPSICGADGAGDGADIDEGAALLGRSACDGVSVSTVSRARLTGSVGDVQGNGHRGRLELVSKLAFASWQCARDAQREAKKLNCAPYRRPSSRSPSVAALHPA